MVSKLFIGAIVISLVIGIINGNIKYSLYSLIFFIFLIIIFNILKDWIKQ